MLYLIKRNEYESIKQGMVNYSDVTDKWLDSATPNSNRVLDAKYFEAVDGTKYYVDNKNVVLDYSPKEKEIAVWLESTFGGKLYMLPRINIPEGIMTADYFFKGEYWDLKEIKTNGKNVIDNRINGLKKQTKKFIFDISGNLLSDNEITVQIEKIYKSPKRDWVDKVILIRNTELIKVYERNKRD